MGSSQPQPLRRTQLTSAARRLWLRRRGALVLFGLAVALLIALSVWWLYFLSAAIEREAALTYALLERDVEREAHRLASEAAAGRLPPPAGVLAADPRLEVVQRPPRSAPAGLKQPIAAQPDLYLQPTAAHLAEIEARKAAKERMIAGEGALLTSLLIAVVAMLYRLIVAERRFRTEMQDFLGRVTHEMKTPLAGIKAVLQTVSATPLPAAEVQSFASLALREVEREEHLIQNLLLAQRLRLPDQQLHSEPVALSPLVMRLVQHRQETLGASVDFVVKDHPQAIALGDPTAIWTILENLVDNAVKYGGTRLGLVIQPEGQMWTLHVTDNGIGFVPAAAEALFGAFERQSGASAARHGTGLGLHISRSLAERMGGALTAHSDGPGQGATFCLALAAAPRA